MIPLNQQWLDALLPEQKKFALEKRGRTFLYKFLWKHGEHLFIIGNTGSGKTQKAYFIVRWIATTKETVIWLDSAKNGELLPLLTLGHPVQIICPKGTDVIIKEWNDDEHQYTRMKNHPLVTTVPDAGSAWWAVRKKYINIFCFRNAFDKAEDRLKWMGELFASLGVWTRKQTFPHIYPFCFVGDEAHWFNAGAKLTSDQERTQLAELITEHALTIRGPGGRLVLIAQGHKNLPVATRENLQTTLLCRGAKVSPEENNTLSEFNNRTSRYNPDQGLFVYPGGYTYPPGWPWPFPFFPMPKLRIEYVGEFDSKTDKQIKEEEIEQEIIPDLSKYNALCQDLIGYEVPHISNRYELISYHD